jgi:hypothetical protein
MNPTPAGKDTSLSKSLIVIFAVYALCLLAIYILLQERYRPNDCDDPWSLSFAYNYLHRGIETDLTFGTPHSPSAVQYFGKTYSFILGNILDVVGWTKTNGHLVSLFFMLSALFVWFHVLRELNYSKAICYSFTLSALLFDPFFTAATTARPDAFVFLMISCSLFLFLLEKHFLSMVIACVAIESHPMGLIVFFYIAAYSIFRTFPASPQKKPAFKFPAIGAGLLVGCFYFAWLHWNSLSNYFSIASHYDYSFENKIHNFLFDYFFETKYLRHIPELVLILVGLIFYFTRKIHLSDRFMGAFVLGVVVFSLLLKRPNFHYAIFCYPAFLLLILRMAEITWDLRKTMLGLLFLLVPQYSYAYYQNHSYSIKDEIKAIGESVPHDHLPVLGGANHWFAFYQRDFFSNDYGEGFAELGLKQFYLIEDDNYRMIQGKAKKTIETNYSGTLVQNLNVNHQLFVIKFMSVKD